MSETKANQRKLECQFERKEQTSRQIEEDFQSNDSIDYDNELDDVNDERPNQEENANNQQSENFETDSINAEDHHQEEEEEQQQQQIETDIHDEQKQSLTESQQPKEQLEMNKTKSSNSIKKQSLTQSQSSLKSNQSKTNSIKSESNVTKIQVSSAKSGELKKKVSTTRLQSSLNSSPNLSSSESVSSSLSVNSPSINVSKLKATKNDKVSPGLAKRVQTPIDTSTNSSMNERNVLHPHNPHQTARKSTDAKLESALERNMQKLNMTKSTSNKAKQVNTSLSK